MPVHKPLFEILMLICFGVSWPVSITKALRTKVVHGKSPFFMMLVITGYICGVIHKTINTPGDWVRWLYAFNAMMVAVDLTLYMKYRNNTVQ